MTTYTIRCSEHNLSDGRLIGVTFDDAEDAQAAADRQTQGHREEGLDCVFSVIDANEPLILSEDEFVAAIFSGLASPFDIIRRISPLSWELDDLDIAVRDGD